MKIDFISDLHLEMNNNPSLSIEEGGDILLLLGDITCLRYFEPHRTDADARKNIERFSNLLQGPFGHYKKILYIPGNHEYYGHDILGAKNSLIENIDDRIVFHDRITYNQDGVLIIMATLWTNFDNRDTIAMHAASHGMNDYRIIGHGEAPLTPEHTATIHDSHIGYIKSVYENRKENEQVIVATHHAPSFKSHNAVRFGNDDILMHAYCSDYNNLIGYSNISYWLHGHTHSNVEYEIGETKVASAMYGYDLYDRIPRPMKMGRIEI